MAEDHIIESKVPSGKALRARIVDLLFAVLCALGIGAVAGTLGGFFGRHWWALDLASHFRLQFLLLLGLTSITFLLRGNRYIALSFGAGVLINFLMIAPFGFPRSSSFDSPSIRVGIINLDIYNQHPALVVAELRRQEPDVVALLEYTDIWVERLNEVRTDFPYATEAPRNNPFGIALLSRLPLIDSKEFQLIPEGGPAISARIRLAGRQLGVLAFHPFPPLRKNGTALRDRELKAAGAYVHGRLVPTVVIGDLNTTYWSYATEISWTRAALGRLLLDGG